NTRIWCRLADDRTAAEATDGLGPCTVHLPETGVGLSYGGVGGLSGASHRRLVAKEVPLLRPSWLTPLPRGEAVVRMKGELWKLRVPLLPPVAAAEMETLGLTALWQGLERKDTDDVPMDLAAFPWDSPDELCRDGDEGGPRPADAVRTG